MSVFFFTEQVSPRCHWNPHQAAAHKKVTHSTVICISEPFRFNCSWIEGAETPPTLTPAYLHLCTQPVVMLASVIRFSSTCTSLVSQDIFIIWVISWFLKKMNVKSETCRWGLRGAWWLLKASSMHQIWFVDQSVCKGNTQKHISCPFFHFHLFPSPAAHTLQHWRGCSKLAHHNAFVITVISQKKKKKQKSSTVTKDMKSSGA